MINDQKTAQQSLCLSCGLCCDGTIFGRVQLKADDILGPLKSGLIQIELKGTKTFFRQPCSAYRESCCQIYEDRPTNCRDYRCELLKKYEAQVVTWEDAQEKIRRARKLREEISATLRRLTPGRDDMSISAVLKIVPSPEELRRDQTLLKKWGSTLLPLSALLDCLQSHFKSRKSLLE